MDQIDFLITARIREILKEKKLTVYHISQKCENLSDSTLSNLLKHENRIPNVRTLWDFLKAVGMSWSEFFREKQFDALAPDEQKVVEFYIKLPAEAQKGVLAFIEAMQKEGKK